MSIKVLWGYSYTHMLHIIHDVSVGRLMLPKSKIFTIWPFKTFAEPLSWFSIQGTMSLAKIGH